MSRWQNGSVVISANQPPGRLSADATCQNELTGLRREVFFEASALIVGCSAEPASEDHEPQTAGDD